MAVDDDARICSIHTQALLPSLRNDCAASFLCQVHETDLIYLKTTDAMGHIA